MVHDEDDGQTVGQNLPQEPAWRRPAAHELRDFEFNLPPSPYSFSGRLITLSWGVEVVTDKQSDVAEFVLSPHGREVLLTEFRA